MLMLLKAWCYRIFLRPFHVIAFRRWLWRHNACRAAMNWTKEKTLPESWEACTNPCWLLWVATRCVKENHPISVALNWRKGILSVAREANHGRGVNEAEIELPGYEFARATLANNFPEICDAIRKAVGHTPPAFPRRTYPDVVDAKGISVS